MNENSFANFEDKSPEIPLKPVENTFIQDNFDMDKITGEKKLSPISSFFRNIFKKENNPSQNEVTFGQKMVTERQKMQISYEVSRSQIVETFSGKIEKMSQAMRIDRTEVSEENLANISEKIKEIIHNDEGIEENIDVKIGDKVVWNAESQTLVILDVAGKNKFLIKFEPETPEESQKNEEMARESIERGGQALGDWLVRRGPWPGKGNSCGASCGSLLNQFGFKNILPQSGRDGKNWDSIIENYASDYFEKIPVNHPDDAPAGSVLVFNENATRGSSARRKYGHVEIKGSDGMYYSYYKSINAAGSSRTSNKNPDSYKKETGFTGYAYVYNGKNPKNLG